MPPHVFSAALILKDLSERDWACIGSKGLSGICEMGWHEGGVPPSVFVRVANAGLTGARVKRVEEE